MSPRRLPSLSAREVIKTLESFGFESVRQSGSHVRMRHEDGRSVTVPVHSSRDVPVGTMRSILRQAKLTPEEFSKAL